MLVPRAFGRRILHTALVALGLPAITGSAAASPALAPPFRKKWTGPRVESIYPSGVRVPFLSDQQYGVLDARTGKPLWAQSIPDDYRYNGGGFEGAGDTLYFLLGGWKLAAVRAEDGKQLWSLPISSKFPSGPCVQGNRLIYEASPSKLVSRDRRTRQLQWSLVLESTPVVPRYGVSCPLRVSGGEMVVGTYAGAVHRVRIADGAVVWGTRLTGRSDEGDPDSLAASTESADRVFLLTHQGRISAVRRQDGSPIWEPMRQFNGATWPVMFGGNLLIVDTWGVVHALNTETGVEVWNRELSLGYTPKVSNPQVVAGAFWVTVGSTVYCLGPDGALRWKWDTRQNFDRIFAVVGPNLYLATHDGLQRYAHGNPRALPRSPAARIAIVRKLLERLDSLTLDDQFTLRELGDVAFPILTSLLESRLREYARLNGPKSRYDDRTMAAYSRYADVRDALSVVMRPEHTSALIRLAAAEQRITSQRWGEGEVMELLLWGARRGTRGHPVSDPRLVLPLAFRILRIPGHEKRRLALFYVADHGRSPSALQFLRRFVTDPGTATEERDDASLGLAQWGSEEDRRGVFAMRSTERKLPPLAAVMQLDKMGFTPQPNAKLRHFDTAGTLLDVKADRSGVSWGLVASAVLGDYDDLWRVRRDGVTWVDPQFLGVKRGELPAGDWLNLALNPETVRDTDGDGWNDRAEARLGTDPHSPDTDGDGLPDGQDRNPLAAPRALTDEEKILGAAFERYYRRRSRSVPLVVDLPVGMKPFELNGPEWLVLMPPPQPEIPVASLFWKGAGYVSFTPPELDYHHRPIHHPTEHSGVVYAPNGQEAKLILRVSYAGLDGAGSTIQLRRVGDDWVVTNIQQEWVN